MSNDVLPKATKNSPHLWSIFHLHTSQHIQKSTAPWGSFFFCASQTHKKSTPSYIYFAFDYIILIANINLIQNLVLFNKLIIITKTKIFFISFLIQKISNYNQKPLIAMNQVAHLFLLHRYVLLRLQKQDSQQISS